MFKRTISLRDFKECLPQILLGPFLLITLSHISSNPKEKHIEKLSGKEQLPIKQFLIILKLQVKLLSFIVILLISQGIANPGLNSFSVRTNSTSLIDIKVIQIRSTRSANGLLLLIPPNKTGRDVNRKNIQIELSLKET